MKDFTQRNCRTGRERLVLSPDQAVAMIAALQLGDVGGDSLWVRRRLYKGDLDVPKTRRSSRPAALTTATLALLKEWTEAWLFPSENGLPLRRDNLWRRYMLPRLKPVALEWATLQVMRRTFATLSKEAGVDAHTRSAQMGNTVDVNENEYAVASFEKSWRRCVVLNQSSFNDGAGSARMLRLFELRLREEISGLAGGCR